MENMLVVMVEEVDELAIDLADYFETLFAFVDELLA